MKVIKGFPYDITNDDVVSGTCIPTANTVPKRLHGNEIYSMECIPIALMSLAVENSDNIVSELPWEKKALMMYDVLLIL